MRLVSNNPVNTYNGPEIVYNKTSDGRTRKRLSDALLWWHLPMAKKSVWYETVSHGQCCLQIGWGKSDIHSYYMDDISMNQGNWCWWHNEHNGMLTHWGRSCDTPLTQWGRDKMAAISQTTFSSAFSWMTMYDFRKWLHWSVFLMFQLTIFQHWFR